MKLKQLHLTPPQRAVRNRLSGRTALISGGANGVGAAAVRSFVAEGAEVAFLDRDAAAGVALEAELSEAGAAAFFLEADVSQADEVARAVGAVIERLGHIDILFNHAGDIIVKPFLSYTIEDWDRMMNNNAKSAFLVTRSVLPGMLKRGYGTIINTSSTAISVCSKMESAYIASKAAMHQMARAVA
ncbi:MAG: SDR family NAD(P)-dependent oxidoreductase, partial [Pseudomonadota bacterium]